MDKKEFIISYMKYTYLIVIGEYAFFKECDVGIVGQSNIP